jgi:hypothetical protein
MHHENEITIIIIILQAEGRGRGAEVVCVDNTQWRHIVVLAVEMTGANPSESAAISSEINTSRSIS